MKIGLKTAFMKIVNVNLPHHQYEIHVGSGLLTQSAALIRPFLKRPSLAIVTDKTVASHYLEPLIAHFEAEGISVRAVIVEPGEASKSWPVLEYVVEELLAQKIERDDLVIALGGGVIGDLVGFASAILRRGVRFVQMPTSLLAQVDSSVGGKTGINSQSGKNLIGAFHQPEIVIADIDVLQSLSPREYLSGYGEVVKYGLLGDAQFFAYCESHAQDILAKNPEVLEYIVAHSCQMKANIVERDEKEKGERALLNLGHTFGHALEQATGYSQKLLHGEAVAIGCLMAAELSERLGFLANGTQNRIRAHLKTMGMKTELRDIDGQKFETSQLIHAMAQDKKVVNSVLTFIMLEAIGKAFITQDITMGSLETLLQEQIDNAEKPS